MRPDGTDQHPHGPGTMNAAAVTRHHRPGRTGRKAATSTPVKVATAPPLFRFVRPWWSTTWAALGGQLAAKVTSRFTRTA